MSSRYSEAWNNINKKIMKSFHVAWSDEPDLKLARSSETALFKLFPLGSLLRQFFSISTGFAFFYRTASPKAAKEWSTINTSLEKDFISDRLQSFFLVFNRTHLLLLTSFGVIHLWSPQKMTNFTNPSPHFSLRAPFLFSKINNKYIFFKTLKSSKSLRHSVLCNRINCHSVFLRERLESIIPSCQCKQRVESWDSSSHLRC